MLLVSVHCQWDDQPVKLVMLRRAGRKLQRMHAASTHAYHLTCLAAYIL
jgi:hypothetical protein